MFTSLSRETEKLEREKRKVPSEVPGINSETLGPVPLFCPSLYPVEIIRFRHSSYPVSNRVPWTSESDLETGTDHVKNVTRLGEIRGRNQKSGLFINV